ncbi:hypothetical protein N781_01250 [Pontibacillus halophilus JSM 076056 = DSM 19796]|uniref:Uncharacterized protein n=1 Tax=Pontibacillus halophilus JSM 076056 = DSM 19796 TaxID=1385510 RepID=A0A0A5GLC5_9BACI|nr:AimR family lysis-lysogeny pheromone receptor [Pontibacillus halophilus]KGX94071.1 hypothetical protein N781_01250 [Pontibacillus halophilus JSM 076056 = DSM 19796]
MREKSKRQKATYDYTGLYNRTHPSGSVLNEFTSRGKDEELPLHLIQLKLSMTYNTEETMGLLKEYCLLTENDWNMRLGLEYLYMNAYFNELTVLIRRNKESDNEENQQWGRLYELILDRMLGRVGSHAFLDGLNGIRLMSKELTFVVTYFVGASYGDMRRYGVMGNYYSRLSKQRDDIEDPMLLSFIEMKMNDFMFHYHWRRNELVLARKHGYWTLNHSQSSYKKVQTHENLALSYLLESYEQAMYHIHEAKKMAEQHRYHTRLSVLCNNDIPFIAAYHGQADGIETTDEIEQAHLHIAKGNIEEALEILLPIESPTPFQQYYLGKALKDQKLLWESYHRFKNEWGHYYFAQLPVQELKKLQ